MMIFLAASFFLALSRTWPCAQAWISPLTKSLPRASTRATSRLFYQPMHPDGETSNPQWDFQNNQVPLDGGDAFAPYTDMHRNARGEFEADDHAYWNGQQGHPEPSRRQAPLSIFQEDHLLTAELPLEDSNYGSYSMIGNEPMGYHHQGYNTYASPFLHHNLENEYTFPEPIMPDHHQNVFDSNLMCVGGDGDDDYHDVDPYYGHVL